MTPVPVIHQQMNMIRRDCLIQYTQAEPFPGFEQPGNLSLTIPGEFQQKLALVTTMSEMPNLPRHIMTMCPGHDGFLSIKTFQQEKGSLRAKSYPLHQSSASKATTCLGPTRIVARLVHLSRTWVCPTLRHQPPVAAFGGGSAGRSVRRLIAAARIKSPTVVINTAPSVPS